MSNKTKKPNKTTEKLGEVALQGGVLLMALAATLGMMELPEKTNSRVVVPNQPSFAMASPGSDINNPLQREREEVSPHYISYSVIQRTAARSGRR